jgi:hypothetical protein
MRSIVFFFGAWIPPRERHGFPHEGGFRAASGGSPGGVATRAGERGIAADLINHLVQAGPFCPVQAGAFCRCVLPYPLRVIDAVQAERLRPAFLMQPVDTSPDALVQRL